MTFYFQKQTKYKKANIFHVTLCRTQWSVTYYLNGSQLPWNVMLSDFDTPGRCWFRRKSLWSLHVTIVRCSIDEVIRRIRRWVKIHFLTLISPTNVDTHVYGCLILVTSFLFSLIWFICYLMANCCLLINKTIYFKICICASLGVIAFVLYHVEWLI